MTRCAAWCTTVATRLALMASISVFPVAVDLTTQYIYIGRLEHIIPQRLYSERLRQSTSVDQVWRRKQVPVLRSVTRGHRDTYGYYNLGHLSTKGRLSSVHIYPLIHSDLGPYNTYTRSFVRHFGGLLPLQASTNSISHNESEKKKKKGNTAAKPEHPHRWHELETGRR